MTKAQSTVGRRTLREIIPSRLADTPNAQKKVYCLFDSSVIAAYYLPQSHPNSTVSDNAKIIVESVRSRARRDLFYIPNFCIAEVFSVFAKHAYGDWNRHVRNGTIDGRVHKSLRQQFQKDIHNAALFYHYELARYHVLSIGLVAPIDHYYKLSRSRTNSRSVSPASTFDHLIIAMGIHLTKIHVAGNVVVVTADRRLADVIRKCRSTIPPTVQRTLNLDWTDEFVGVPFKPESFPLVLDLQKAKVTEFQAVFGEWPLPIMPRYRRPYHLRSGIGSNVTKAKNQTVAGDQK